MTPIHVLDRMMAGEFPSVRKGPTMYLSPNHPDYDRLRDRATAAAPTGPPAPTGTLLASFPRPSHEGQDCELRLVLDEYQGNPYLSLRVWQRDASGAFWPTRRGVSVRMGEAEGIAAALVQALGRGEPAAPAQPTREAPPRRRQRPEGCRQWDDGGSPPPPSKGFDDAY